MQAQVTTIFNILSAGINYVIPIYQRRYAWSIESVDDLLATLLDPAAVTPILGAITCVNEGFYRQIIDGQQRLTTLSLILASIKARNSIENILPANQIGYCDICLTAFNGTTRIQLKENDQRIYSGIILNLPNEVWENTAEKISANYSFIREKVNLIPQESMMSLLNRVLQTQVVEILLMQNENPQSIFEALNSKGQDLTKIDLITNLLFMELGVVDQNNLYVNYWSRIEDKLSTDELSTDFLRSFLSIKLGRVENITSDNLYQIFKCEYLEELKEADGNFFRSNAIRELFSFFISYETITNPEHSNAPTEVRDAILKINGLRIFQSNALLAFLDEKRRSGQIAIDDFLRILNNIESYIARRLLTRLSSAGLFRILTRMAIYLNSMEGEELVSASQGYLAALNGTRRFPRNEELCTELTISNFYLSSNSIYFFQRIINSVFPGFNIHIEDSTLEHIMPQTMNQQWILDLGENYEEIHENYKHVIGNLTLIPRNLNAYLGQNSIQGKINIFRNGANTEGGFLPPPPYQRIFEVIYNANGQWGRNEINRNSKFYTSILIDIFPDLPEFHNEEICHTVNFNYSDEDLHARFGSENRITIYRRMEIELRGYGINPELGGNYVRFINNSENYCISIHPTYGLQNVRVMLGINSGNAAPGTPMAQLIEGVIQDFGAQATWVNHPGAGAAGNFRIIVNNENYEKAISVIRDFLKLYD